MNKKAPLLILVAFLAYTAGGCAVIDSQHSQFVVATTGTALSLNGYDDSSGNQEYLTYYKGSNPSSPDEYDTTPGVWKWIADSSGNPIPITNTEITTDITWDNGQPAYRWSTNSSAVLPPDAWTAGAFGYISVPLVLRRANNFTSTASAAVDVTTPGTTITPNAGTGTDATVSCPGGAAPKTPSDNYNGCLTTDASGNQVDWFRVQTADYVPMGAACNSNVVMPDGSPAVGNCATNAKYGQLVPGGPTKCISQTSAQAVTCSNWGRDYDCNGLPDVMVPGTGAGCSDPDTLCGDGTTISGTWICQNSNGPNPVLGQGCSSCTLACQHNAPTYCGGWYGIDGTRTNTYNTSAANAQCGVGIYCSSDTQCRPGYMCDSTHNCTPCTASTEEQRLMLCPDRNPSQASQVCYPPLY